MEANFGSKLREEKFGEQIISTENLWSKIGGQKWDSNVFGSNILGGSFGEQDLEGKFFWEQIGWKFGDQKFLEAHFLEQKYCGREDLASKIWEVVFFRVEQTRLYTKPY